MTISDNSTPHKASDYDLNIRPTIPFYDLIHQEAIDLVQTVKPNVENWLDAGCGTGHLVEKALPLFPHTRFIMSDSSEAMLQQAMKRFADQPQHRVEVLPPVRNERLGSFSNRLAPQIVTSILCNHYLQPEQRREALAACYKLLQPGGMFVTFENIDTRTSTGAQIGLERWKRYQLGQGRPLPTVEDHVMRFKTEYFPIPLSEHFRLLEDIGFQTVEAFWLSHMQAGFYAIK